MAVKKRNSTQNLDDKLLEEKSTQKKLGKQKIILVLAILTIVAVLYNFRGLFVAATVNGEPINRLSIIKQLEKQTGKQALEALVTKTLILQEAKKQNITVSQSEIDTEIKTIEKSLTGQGQSLDQALATRGMSKEDLIEQIKIQKIVEKIVGKDIKVTDKEVNDFVDKNKVTFTDQNKSTVIGQVKQQIKQQKLSESFQNWIGKLQKDAKINYIVNY
ncbi:MAG: SurA N-terminal domain-containing protein [Candidatus Levybacteria bacterium]|nr:SurA N-terminal domain-containing protein [Candidatus Levybacteria bacterium]